MRVAIIGLGGVGGYICASFAKAGVDVVGFARGEHLSSITKNGLTIVEDEAQWSVEIDAREINMADGYFDAVLFCVKSYDLQESYNAISSFIDKNSILISFANGVDNAQKLKEMSNSIVLDGAIYILSHIQSAGVIRKKGKVFAAVFGPDNTASNKIAKLFEDVKLRYKIESDIKTAIWKKYIFISAFATITSYYNTTIGEVYEKHYDEIKELLEEIALVAKSYGVEIDDEVQKALNTASKLPYDASTSMYLDFKNGKKTELESLSGYVAKTKGVKTPLMRKMYEALVN